MAVKTKFDSSMKVRFAHLHQRAGLMGLPPEFVGRVGSILSVDKDLHDEPVYKIRFEGDEYSYDLYESMLEKANGGAEIHAG